MATNVIVTAGFINPTGPTVTTIAGFQGPPGPTGSPGATGATGPAGPGVPTGGATNAMLVKNSGSNYDTKWIAQPSPYTLPTASLATLGGIQLPPTTLGGLTIVGNALQLTKPNDVTIPGQGAANTFTPIDSVPTSTLEAFDLITVAGPTGTADFWPVMLEGPLPYDVKINGVSYGPRSGHARSGDTVQARVTSSALANSTDSYTLRVGGLAITGTVKTAAWTPMSLTPLIYLLASPQYCFSDAAGTVPCAIGDMIYIWKDQSGNAINFAQPTSGFRFILRQVNGFFYADGTITSSGMIPSPNTFTVPAAPYSWLVAELTQDTGGAGRRTVGGQTGNNLISISRNDGNSVFNGSTVTGSYANTLGRHTMVFNASTSGGAWLDGTQVASGSFTNAWTAPRIGYYSGFSFGDSGPEYPKTYIRCIVLVARAVTAGEIALFNTFGTTA